MKRFVQALNTGQQSGRQYKAEKLGVVTTQMDGRGISGDQMVARNTNG